MAPIAYPSSSFPAAASLPPKVKYFYHDPLAVEKLSQALNEYLRWLDPELSRELVVVGIGTDRSTGDSLGPLVGSLLQENISLPLNIYGTLEDPVHASNLAEKLAFIESRHPQSIIIAIDACLGQSENVGSITLATGSLKPGAGVNKNLPSVGDLHFTGTVNVSGYMEYFVLQNTRLSLVLQMARIIAGAIEKGVKQSYNLTCNYLLAVEALQ
ncbi:MAG: hypothetical protein PWP65_1560 [Clostridia bacterium]|nr:hypothetical protein [Clostridia bacterium]